MCGRYVSGDIRALEREWETIHRGGGWEDGIYNAAPTTQLPVVRTTEGKSVVQAMRWGFVPSWWQVDDPPRHTINARTETVVAKPMWRNALRHGRALVPARGYFEWRQASKPKQAYFITLPDEPLICFAGLWSSWRDTLSFTILVGPAAPHLAHIHDRMPLTLPRSAWGAWLDPHQKDGAEALSVAQAAALSHFVLRPVSAYVNNAKNQGERCIEPIDQELEERQSDSGAA